MAHLLEFRTTAGNTLVVRPEAIQAILSHFDGTMILVPGEYWIVTENVVEAVRRWRVALDKNGSDT